MYIEGRLAEARDLGTSLRERAAETGFTRVVAPFEGTVLLLLGFADEFPEPGGAVERSGRAFGALVLAHQGRIAEARDILRNFPTAIASDGDESSIRILHWLLEVSVLCHEDETARQLLRRLAPLAGQLDVGISSIGRHCGEAAAMLGQPSEASEYYTSALVLCQKVRFRPEIALIHLDLAELLLEHYPHERDAAIEHLDFAISEFREMKMQPSLERALRHRGLLKA
jgi:hypothetical protein